MPIMSLFAKLFLDKKDFDQKLQDADKKTKTFEERLMGKGAQAFAHGAIAAAVASVAREAIQASEEIDALAAKLELSTEEAGRLRLALKMGVPMKDIGPTILNNEDDQRHVRTLGRLWDNFWSSYLSWETKVAKNIPTPLGVTPGALTKLLNMLGMVSGKKPFVESDAEKRAREAYYKEQDDEINLARSTHVAEQDRILAVEKETRRINDQTETDKLTPGGQLQKLRQREADLKEMLAADKGGQIGMTEGQRADRLQQLAQVRAAIVHAIGNKGQFTPVAGGSFGAIGAYTGAASLEQASGGRQTAAALKEIKNQLATGITIGKLVGNAAQR